MKNTIAFDTETKGLAWWDPNEQAFLASWADARGEYAAPLHTKRDRARFVNRMEKAATVVAHNLSFDTHQTRETVGFDLMANGHVVHDTDLLSRVLHPEGANKGGTGGHKLKDLATVYLRADAKDAEDAIAQMAKDIGLRTLKQTGAYYDVWRAYPEVMEHYARLDARYTYDLFDRWQKELAHDDKARGIYELEMRVAPILIAAECRGVAVDQGAVASLWKEWSDTEQELHTYLDTEFGEDVWTGEGSEDALLEALLKLGVPLHRKTEKTGKLQTNKFALQEFAQDFPQITALLDWRTAHRFLTTYLQPMRDVDVVHTSFAQCGAWTGRMSSRRPNMQNIPKRAGKEVRSMFVPRPGHSFVVADYDGIEARLLAYYLGDPELRQMIEEGYDMHAWMASNIYGGTPDQYHKGTAGEEQRAVAKNTLFAIVYGAGAPRVKDMNKMRTKDEAKALISKIKSSLPGFWKLQKRIRNKVENVGYVNTIYGRKNPVKRDKAYVGLNAIIQGSAADIMKQGCVNVDDSIKDLGGRIELVVHDEVVIEVPTEAAEECLRRTEQAMIEAAPEGLTPSLVVSGSVVETNYADA
jgi:DNA polymerase I-like protein with 3'-5' exonuclease and polymerase domains